MNATEDVDDLSAIWQSVEPAAGRRLGHRSTHRDRGGALDVLVALACLGTVTIAGAPATLIGIWIVMSVWLWDLLSSRPSVEVSITVSPLWSYVDARRGALLHQQTIRHLSSILLGTLSLLLLTALSVGLPAATSRLAAIVLAALLPLSWVRSLLRSRRTVRELRRLDETAEAMSDCQV